MKKGTGPVRHRVGSPPFWVQVLTLTVRSGVTLVKPSHPPEPQFLHGGAGGGGEAMRGGDSSGSVQAEGRDRRRIVPGPGAVPRLG